MFGSIRARLTFQFALCIFAIMLASCLLLVRNAQKQEEDTADDLLQNAARQVEHVMASSTTALNIGSLREVESDLGDYHVSLLLLNSQGRIVEISPPSTSLTQALPGHGHEAEWRTITVPVASYKVVIGLPWTQTQRELNRQARTLLLSSLATALLSTLGAWLLVGRTLSPIGKLSQQARVTEGSDELTQLAAPSHDAEVRELVQTLNDLLARQREASAARGRFYAAASHELRTPLQALSGHLELALQRPRSREEYLAVVQEADAQTRRLRLLVRDLLKLHQVEGNPNPVQTPVDLAEVCLHMVQVLEPMAQARGLILETHIQEHAIISAAPTHADILLRNLLENAIHYSTASGHILVSLTLHDTDAQLEIANSHTVDANFDPERWFEAFYREDASRNQQTGGNGLGLAICKAVAAANSWQLSLSHHAGWITAKVLFALQYAEM